jgi:glycosyltransferase involved in cell wall biosynthesis
LNALADVLLVHLADIDFLHATIPSKVQVSLASGKPILLGVRGDGAALVEAAGAGVCFTPGDAASLAAAIRAMVAMPRSRLKQMGDRGREYYVRHLSLDVGYSRMAELFAGLRRG